VTTAATSPTSSLDELVGAHPDALDRIYRGGRSIDLASLGDAPRGRLLAVGRGVEAFLAMRGVVRLFATDRLPWRGKVFSPDFTTGHNVVLGRRVFPFAIEFADSVVDGEPTLVFRYDEPQHGNPWPVRDLRDELREIGPGVAIGPVLRDANGGSTIVAWWGLSR